MVSATTTDSNRFVPGRRLPGFTGEASLGPRVSSGRARHMPEPARSAVVASFICDGVETREPCNCKYYFGGTVALCDTCYRCFHAVQR